MLDPNANQIGVFYAEIPLSAYLVSVDSLRTTNPLVLVAGGDNSSFFGRTESIGYSRLSFSRSTTRPTEEAILDSAKFSLSISSLTADDLDEAKTFSVHKLTEPILDTAYYNFNHLAYEESPFASGSFMLKENSDTVVHMTLDGAVAEDLFTRLKTEDPVFDNIFSFREYFPGFALKGNPDEETAINVLLGSDTGIKLYYRDDAEDTVSTAYTISTSQSRHFNGVINDPTGTPTEIVAEKDVAYEVGDLVGSKSLLGLVLKLNMEPLSNFLDTLENATFNHVTMEIGPTENFPDSKLPPPSLIPYFTDENNEILTREVDGALYSIQSDVAQQVVTDEDGNVLPAVSTTGTNNLVFNTEKFLYQQSLTAYIDALYRTDVMRTDLLLYPRTPSGNSSPPYSNDFVRSLREYVVNQNSIKLKIFYSKMR
ncbi:hypothetical protein GCM10028791_23790 [Echinicola sediminis]